MLATLLMKNSIPDVSSSTEDDDPATTGSSRLVKRRGGYHHKIRRAIYSTLFSCGNEFFGPNACWILTHSYANLTQIIKIEIST